MSRGLRNCNPGNIRRSGTCRYRGEKSAITDPEFREFAAMEWGYRALFTLLHTYRVRYGLTTLAAFIARWAPPSENSTDAYLRFVAERTGIGADAPLDTLSRKDMIPVAAAMSEVENGVKADWREVERGWELFFEDFGTERP